MVHFLISFSLKALNEIETLSTCVVPGSDILLDVASLFATRSPRTGESSLQVHHHHPFICLFFFSGHIRFVFVVIATGLPISYMIAKQSPLQMRWFIVGSTFKFDKMTLFLVPVVIY